ncbi:uncharacterized protein DUF2802 [Azomonas agilis]|uniref:Uncharacterized protein DUF2802 n=1 Tax=Azomonas agilis TaxID=116849 RepID=A0A562I1M5_9GAMM|nr:DUF2802 domain-containing protein [Azomonas agilis]TWH64931.1 uncharacterized protein DUF2802 [Azomonas agilis]
MLTHFVLLAVLCYVSLIGLFLWLLRQHRTLEQRQETHLAHLEQLVRKLDDRAEAQRISSLRMGEELKALRTTLSVQAERLLRQEQRDLGTEHSFSQAARMATMGASVEELVRSCGLTQGEAELMSRLQQLRDANSASISE